MTSVLVFPPRAIVELLRQYGNKISEPEPPQYVFRAYAPSRIPYAAPWAGNDAAYARLLLLTAVMETRGDPSRESDHTRLWELAAATYSWRVPDTTLPVTDRGGHIYTLRTRVVIQELVERTIRLFTPVFGQFVPIMPVPRDWREPGRSLPSQTIDWFILPNYEVPECGHSFDAVALAVDAVERLAKFADMFSVVESAMRMNDEEDMLYALSSMTAGALEGARLYEVAMFCAAEQMNNMEVLGPSLAALQSESEGFVNAVVRIRVSLDRLEPFLALRAASANV